MWACSFKYSLPNVTQRITNKMWTMSQNRSQTFVCVRATTLRPLAVLPSSARSSQTLSPQNFLWKRRRQTNILPHLSRYRHGNLWLQRDEERGCLCGRFGSSGRPRALSNGGAAIPAYGPGGQGGSAGCRAGHGLPAPRFRLFVEGQLAHRHVGTLW